MDLNPMTASILNKVKTNKPKKEYCLIRQDNKNKY